MGYLQRRVLLAKLAPLLLTTNLQQLKESSHSAQKLNALAQPG